MRTKLSFRFVNDKLNQRFVALINKAGIDHTVDRDGCVHYSPKDEEVVGNDLICSLRNDVFSSWQILSCPKDWVERYKQYMDLHHVPFSVELINEQVSFLIPRRYRPHSWKLQEQYSERDQVVAR
jgi:hypothetical protein